MFASETPLISLPSPPPILLVPLHHSGLPLHVTQGQCNVLLIHRTLFLSFGALFGAFNHLLSSSPLACESIFWVDLLPVLLFPAPSRGSVGTLKTLLNGGVNE